MEVLLQIAPPVQLARPACLVWYAGDPCDQRIQQYRQQLEDQQRQAWQTSITTRYEKQIADQQKQISGQQVQIRTLQARIDSQTLEALRSEARSRSFIDGIGVIIGIGLAFLFVVAAFRRLAQHSPSDSEPSHAAFPGR
ncbi:MAG TPA: hypothetical protein VK466_16810 [Terriglobales bacterium]|nr:hypothetical protein [Terriglobales bacterium]